MKISKKSYSMAGLIFAVLGASLLVLNAHAGEMRGVAVSLFSMIIGCFLYLRNRGDGETKP